MQYPKYAELRQIFLVDKSVSKLPFSYMMFLKALIIPVDP